MAKVKFGMMMTDASGKLGGQVFSKNNGGSYVRTKVTPTNPQSTAQSAIRAIFAGISSAWGALTIAQRDAWDAAVDGFKRTNVFGDLKAPTGKALFQRLNQNLEISGQAQITSPPLVVPATGLYITAAGGGVVAGTFDITTVGDATGQVVQVWATAPLTPGTSFVKNRLRVLDYVAGGADATIDIIAAYTAAYGAPAAGDNIYVAVKAISDTGQASPRSSFKATIVA